MARAKPAGLIVFEDPVFSLLRARIIEFARKQRLAVVYTQSEWAKQGGLIEYAPDQWCVESKSLKLYLWRFRDRPMFAEALAAEIAGEVMTTCQPKWVKVTLTQRPRGGIEVQAVACLPAPPIDA